MEESKPKSKKKMNIVEKLLFEGKKKYDKETELNRLKQELVKVQPEKIQTI